MIVEIKLADYISNYEDNWADELPENCPPEDVSISNGDLFYRFTHREDVITDDDWKNNLQLYPDKKYTGDLLKYAAGLSILNDLEVARQKKLPLLKNRYNGIAEISLVPTDGVIKQTFSEKSHYTWWRTKSCDLSKAHLV